MEKTKKNLYQIILLIFLYISMIITIMIGRNNVTISKNEGGDNPSKLPSNNFSISNNNILFNRNLLGENSTEILDEGSKSNKSLNSIFYFLFIIESLLFSLDLFYLILSKGNEKELNEIISNKIYIIILSLGTLTLTIIITIILVFITKSFALPELEAKGIIEITTDETIENKFYETTETNLNIILVKNGGNATLKNLNLNKTGNSSNIENSDFYGINSVLLVESNSKAEIINSKIISKAKGGDGIFSYGKNSEITITNSVIETYGEISSCGLHATYLGKIRGDNISITTLGKSCPSLASTFHRGEGEIICYYCNLITKGKGSPIIYTNGNITANYNNGYSLNSQIIVKEGNSFVHILNSNFYSSGIGNRNNVDNCGIMIYQNKSVDAIATGDFLCENSSLNIFNDSIVYNSAPFFFITNTNAYIILKNCSLHFGSNILFSSKGTNEWGKKNNNGGHTYFESVEQKLFGNIILDNISSLIFNLTKGSYFEGSINYDNKGEVDLILDINSKIKLTNNSYVNKFIFVEKKNVDLNNFSLFVNGTNWNESIIE